jgi:hypothetical protein
MTTISDPEAIRLFLLGSALPDTELVLTVVTEVKLPKKSPLYGVKKLSTIKVVVNFNYVERAKAHDPTWEPTIKKEDDAKGLWGERLGNTPLVRHNGELYLHCWQLESTGCFYFTTDGEAIGKDKVHEELSDRKPGMPVRRYKLTSIRVIAVA